MNEKKFTRFDRLTSDCLETLQAMRAQVERFEGLENAVQRGHGSTLLDQCTELQTNLRALVRAIEGCKK